MAVGILGELINGVGIWWVAVGIGVATFVSGVLFLVLTMRWLGKDQAVGRRRLIIFLIVGLVAVFALGSGMAVFGFELPGLVVVVMSLIPATAAEKMKMYW